MWFLPDFTQSFFIKCFIFFVYDLARRSFAPGLPTLYDATAAVIDTAAAKKSSSNF